VKFLALYSDFSNLIFDSLGLRRHEQVSIKEKYLLKMVSLPLLDIKTVAYTQTCCL